ncbi:FlgN protein [Sinobaca qinghaiensis]|uniref:FlgN protein n=1 Tax=Sinobaca qinghaiensis TaxID=342944 RepID=A0A419V8T1_9BACL|nr:flagellar protein FlgN [Sinobaca qinghaiensis]RKD76514.1 FlgN protein [Sinobaca qinghaiensis]
MAVKELVDHMKELAGLHEQLHELSLEKTELLKNNEAKQLQELVKKEALCIREVETAETARAAEAEAVAGEYAADEVTIRSLLRVLPEGVQSELRQLQARLGETIQKLQQQQELNRVLLADSLYFLQKNMEWMRPAADQSRYTPPGQKNQTQAYSFFDSKA